MALHILLADDSVPAQNMGKKILTDAGYAVTTVGNGLEALRKIAETVPDIAILDIFMPGYTGLEICQKLRANQSTALLPVILTVGKLEPYRAEDGEHVHSNAVIVKPFAAAELISAVRSLVGGPPTSVPEQVPDPLEQPSLHPLANASSAFVEHAPTPAPEAIPEEPADEPLFTYASATMEGTESLPASLDSGYGAEPLPESDAIGPESLMFNPDAQHTPFSASATDLLPSLPQGPAGSEPFTEFALESPQSVYSGGGDFSASGEQDTPEESLSPATGSMQEMLDPLSSPYAQESILPQESDSPAEAAPIESALEISPVDPLFETSQEATPPGVLSQSNLEVGGSPELESGFGEAGSDGSEELLSADEDPRRRAFEDLFNSSELPPLEESPVVSSAMHTDILPSISTRLTPESAEVQADPELEPLGRHFGGDTAAPDLSHEADPYLLEEEEERRAIGSIPDRDELLEHSQDSPTPVVGASSEELLSTGEQFPLQATTPFEVEPTPAQAFAPEVESVLTHASAPEPLAEQEEQYTPASQSAGAPVETVSAIEPAPESAQAAVEEHLHADTEQVAHVDPVPEHAVLEPIPSVDAHSAVYTLAELATGAGLAATAVHMHSVEPEVQSPFLSPAPPPHEPEAHAAVVDSSMTAPTSPAPVTKPEPAAHTELVVNSEPLVSARPDSVQAAPTTEPKSTEPHAVAVQSESVASAATGETAARSPELERVHDAVERVFERFKPLLIAAIVREMARHD